MIGVKNGQFIQGGLKVRLAVGDVPSITCNGINMADSVEFL